MKSYLEHVAVPVTDLEWSVRFYAEAFGMEETRRREEAGVPRQVWLAGGLQLVEAAAGAAGSETGWSHHLGLVVEDLAAALRAALRFEGVRLLDRGPAKWLELPDGTVLELFQAKAGTVEAARAVDGIDLAATKRC